MEIDWPVPAPAPAVWSGGAVAPTQAAQATFDFGGAAAAGGVPVFSAGGDGTFGSRRAETDELEDALERMIASGEFDM